MKNSLYSINTFVYVSLFACLFNLATNDEEGYFFLTHSDTGKSWNITWDDSANGKKMAEFIKNREGKQIELEFEYNTIDSYTAGFRYKDDTANLFKFGSFSGSKVTAASYEITVVDDKFLYFVIKNNGGTIKGKKVGQLKDGKNGLSDFNAELKNGENKNSFILGYQANSNPSSDASSDASSVQSGDTCDENCNKWLIIPILLILVLIFTALFFVFQ